MSLVVKAPRLIRQTFGPLSLVLIITFLSVELIALGLLLATFGLFEGLNKYAPFD
jgi:hypothetical protein